MGLKTDFTQSFDAQDWARAFVEHVHARGKDIATEAWAWFREQLLTEPTGTLKTGGVTGDRTDG